MPADRKIELPQPDVSRRLQTLYVQDTARIAWAHPSDAAASFTDARKAFYVAWQPLRGEMGPALASFARRGDAEAFVRSHGGALLTFDMVTPELVSTLGYGCPPQRIPERLVRDRVSCVKGAGSVTSMRMGE